MSYKIIKNQHISYAEAGVSVSDIKLNDRHKDLLLGEEIIQNPVEGTFDIEKIKAEIKEKLSLENEQEKQALIDKAMNEFRAEAEKLKKEIIDQGYKEGHKEGYKKGIEDCKDECTELKKGALNLITQAEKKVKEYYKLNKDNIIKLAGDMAESIVNVTIDLSSENLLLLIKPIIDLNDRNELIVISCHPDNYDFLKKHVTQLELSAPNARFVILSDNNLEKNGCIIENDNQSIDLQIKKQIDSIIEDISALEV